MDRLVRAWMTLRLTVIGPLGNAGLRPVNVDESVPEGGGFCAQVGSQLVERPAVPFHW